MPPRTRFFEYEVSWVDVPYLVHDEASNTSYFENVTELAVVPTHLRQDVLYIQVGISTYGMRRTGYSRYFVIS